METSLRDILVEYIESALDLDDLENIGDYVRSILVTAGIPEWQEPLTIKQLHTGLMSELNDASGQFRKIRLKAAISYFEADFMQYLIAVETETLSRNN